MSKPKAVVLLSGGLDSTTLLAYLRYLDYDVLPLSIDYGQRHHRELDSVDQILKHYGLNGHHVDMSFANVFDGSSQTNSSIPVPHGHYTDESMKITVVPNRNMVLLSLATAYAMSKGAGFVAYAAHAGDHAIYADCRPEFVIVMNEAIRLASDEKVFLIRPFIDITKADIVKRGSALKVPYRLTWSCYDPQRDGNEYVHCGKCGTCVERIEAFKLAEVPDPTEYAK